MDKVISELVSYGMVNGLIAEDDKVYVINRLLELFDKGVCKGFGMCRCI